MYVETVSVGNSNSGCFIYEKRATLTHLASLRIACVLGACAVEGDTTAAVTGLC
jgi:hypothetical protein